MHEGGCSATNGFGDQKPERMRPLNKEEVGAIYKAVGL